MVETIQKNGLWHVALIEKDLIEQAGFNDSDFEYDLGFFRYKGRPVITSHRFNEHLVVSMEEDDDDMKNIIDGFSKVVGYEPFCKYILMDEEGSKTLTHPTYEWDKVNPDRRLQVLSDKETTKNLTRLL